MKAPQVCRSADCLIRLDEMLRQCLWSDETITRSGQRCELTLLRPDYDAARMRRRSWFVTECDVPLRPECITVNHCHEVLKRHDPEIGVYELAKLSWDEERQAILFRFFESLELEFLVSELEVVHQSDPRAVGILPIRYLLHFIESYQSSSIRFLNGRPQSPARKDRRTKHPPGC